MKRADFHLLLHCILGLLGVAFFVMALVAELGEIRIWHTWEHTTARIVQIHLGDATVSYTVKGEPYEGKIEREEDMERLRTVEIWYNPGHPAEIRSVVLPIYLVWFALLGVVLGGGAGARFFIDVRNDITGRRKLIDSGVRIDAAVKEVVVNKHFLRRRRLYRIVCEAEYKKERRSFQSVYLSEDPTLKLERENIRTLPVFVDERKWETYHVDLSEVVGGEA